MKNILFINFGSLNDLILSSMIAQNAAESEGANVSITTNSRHKKFIESLAPDLTVIGISADQISSMLKSPLISDVQALNLLEEEVSKLRQTSWNLIINLSNDDFSINIGSMLETKDYRGIRKSPQLIDQFCSQWSFVSKSLQGTESIFPLSKIEVYERISGWKATELTPKTNEDLYTVTKKNFSIIKDKTREDGIPKKIVGIFINPETKDISTYTKIIDYLYNTDEYLPINISLPDDNSIQQLKSLNSEFNDSLISTTTSIQNLHIIFSQLDFLICDSLPVANIAAIKRCKTVLAITDIDQLNEVCASESTLGLLVNKSMDAVNRLPQNIDLAINELLHPRQRVESKDTYTYKFTKDVFGPKSTPLTPPREVDAKVVLARLMMYSSMNYNIEKSLIQSEFHIFNQDELLQDYLVKEKELITTISKNILNSLRLLKSELNANFPSQKFSNSVQMLLNTAPNNMVASIPLQLFRSSISTLPSNTDDAVQKTEELLFNLKSYYKTLVGIIYQVLEQTSPDPYTNPSEQDHKSL